jgi:ABC-type dipeptide/oligopeptide/nickel transport system permease subunit
MAMCSVLVNAMHPFKLSLALRVRYGRLFGAGLNLLGFATLKSAAFGGMLNLASQSRLYRASGWC